METAVSSRYPLGLVALALCALSAGAHADFDVRDYGAVGDKSATDTPAIQAAIDAAHAAGGGTVHFPAGDYLSGALTVRSNVTLDLEPGATLFASQDKANYPEGRSELLFAEDAENIRLIGSGAIHGQATADLRRKPPIEEPWPEFRTRILFFRGCRNVHIRDITILYSDSWTLHLQRCDTVYIDGVTIHNNYFRTNSDGIDPNSCRNVHISNCHIVAGDDCIVLKATEDAPCENVVIVNCTLETIATALKLGTESVGDFRDIRVSNCTIRNSPVGIGFFMKDGGTMERVSFDNISIETADPTEVAYARNSVFPIFLDIEKRHDDSPAGRIREVTFSNLDIHTMGSSVIQGMPERPVENVTLRDVTVRVDKAMDFSERKKKVGGRRTVSNQRDTIYVRKPAYFAFGNVDALTVDNLKVIVSDAVHTEYPRAALYCDAVTGANLRDVHFRPTDGRTPILRLNNCRHTLVSGQIDMREGHVAVTGDETADIVVQSRGNSSP